MFTRLPPRVRRLEELHGYGGLDTVAYFIPHIRKSSPPHVLALGGEFVLCICVVAGVHGVHRVKHSGGVAGLKALLEPSAVN